MGGSSAGIKIRRVFYTHKKSFATGFYASETFAQGVEYVDGFSFGHKLLGAGGGRYLLLCAKDELAAARIREQLTQNPPNNRARFVDMALNNQGLEISRS